jgi:RimJ/RimL family protein N-acetyltransferase
MDDFEAWAEVLCGPAGSWLDGPFDRDAAFVEFAASVGLWLLRGHGVWTVEASADGAVLGFVLIGFEPGDAEPELGYLFRPAAEGQGFATEAATAALAHARDTLRLAALVSYVAPGNHRSAALAKRLGARRDPAAEAALGDDTLVFRHFGPEAAG